MRLTFVRKAADSGDTNCPALYVTDEGSYVVVGRVIDDLGTVDQITSGIGIGERAIEIPADVLTGVVVRASS